MILAMENQHKDSNAPCVGIQVVDEEWMRLGHCSQCFEFPLVLRCCYGIWSMVDTHEEHMVHKIPNVLMG